MKKPLQMHNVHDHVMLKILDFLKYKEEGDHMNIDQYLCAENLNKMLNCMISQFWNVVSFVEDFEHIEATNAVAKIFLLRRIYDKQSHNGGLEDAIDYKIHSLLMRVGKYSNCMTTHDNHYLINELFFMDFFDLILSLKDKYAYYAARLYTYALERDYKLESIDKLLADFPPYETLCLSQIVKKVEFLGSQYEEPK